MVAMLLGSKQSTDILEAIDFFVSAFEFGVQNSMLGVRRMLSLIWSGEATIREAVVAAYKRLYIEVCISVYRGLYFCILRSVYLYIEVCISDIIEENSIFSALRYEKIAISLPLRSKSHFGKPRIYTFISNKFIYSPSQPFIPNINELADEPSGSNGKPGPPTEHPSPGPVHNRVH